MNDQINFYKAKLEYEIDSADLYDSVKEGQNIIIIDARREDAFKNAHIPGAINLPHRNMNEESTADFDRDALYVTYCDGIGCNASTKGALNLCKLGFRVKELLGGIEWWKSDGYETEGEKGSNKGVISCGC